MNPLDLLGHSLFSYEGLIDIRSTRFTLFDLLPAFGGSREHMHLMDAVQLEWADTPDRMPPEVEVTRYRNNGSPFTVTTRVLTHLQVIRFMSRSTGSVGRSARDKSELYMEALEGFILDQHAQILALQEAKLKADAAYVIDGFPSQVLRDANRLYDDARPEVTGMYQFTGKCPDDVTREKMPVNVFNLQGKVMGVLLIPPTEEYSDIPSAADGVEMLSTVTAPLIVFGEIEMWDGVWLQMGVT